MHIRYHRTARRRTEIDQVCRDLFFCLFHGFSYAVFTPVAAVLPVIQPCDPAGGEIIASICGNFFDFRKMRCGIRTRRSQNIVVLIAARGNSTAAFSFGNANFIPVCAAEIESVVELAVVFDPVVIDITPECFQRVLCIHCQIFFCVSHKICAILIRSICIKKRISEALCITPIEIVLILEFSEQHRRLVVSVLNQFARRGGKHIFPEKQFGGRTAQTHFAQIAIRRNFGTRQIRNMTAIHMRSQCIRVQTQSLRHRHERKACHHIFPRGGIMDILPGRHGFFVVLRIAAGPFHIFREGNRFIAEIGKISGFHLKFKVTR